MKFLKIEITNFQKWKHLNIDFTDGVNCIIAPTDSGKSAIIRALCWVLFNKNYKNLRRKDKNNEVSASTSVKLTIEHENETFIVERYVDNKTNYYKFNDEVFKALNKKVPDKIQKLFSVSDINVQTQFDPPFLITSTSGDISKLINEMIGLEEMDAMEQQVNSEMKACLSEEKNLETTISSTQYDLSSFVLLSDFESDYNKASSLYQKIADNDQELRKIALNVSNIASINSTLSLIRTKTQEEECFHSIGAMLKSVQESKEQLDRLRKLTTILSQKNITIPDSSFLDEKYNKLKQVVTTKNTIQKLVEHIAAINKDMKVCSERLKLTEDALSEIKVCPTCGRAIEK